MENCDKCAFYEVDLHIDFIGKCKKLNKNTSKFQNCRFYTERQNQFLDFFEKNIFKNTK